MLKFLKGIWRGLDLLRRGLHLVLLLLIFGILIGALRSTSPLIPSSAALSLVPEGEIVEQLTGDPLQRAFDEASGQGRSETLLWDLTEAIRAAKNDDRIKVIDLNLNRLAGAGQPTLSEITNALADFRSSGKKVVAHGLSFTQAQYYLAAHADEVYLDPLGEVLLPGYEAYRTYLKGLLDKLAVDVHLFRVGEFKTAAENLVRTDMSEADREETRVYLGALWDGYKSAVAKARQLEPTAIDVYADSYIDALKQAKGEAAKIALDAKLITGIKTPQQVEARLRELMGQKAGDSQANPSKRLPTVRLEQYLPIVHAKNLLIQRGSGKVGVVIASGNIMDGEQPQGTVGGDTLAELLRQAREDDDISAVVLRVDSPGGSIYGSEAIYREVAALEAADKPVVVSMGDLAASGGYYIAAPARKIISDPMTLTGSIGIFAAVPTFDRTLSKVGVTVDGLGTTKLSGKLRLDRPLDPDLSEYVQQSLNFGYETFLKHVADGRKTTRDAVHEVAQGRVWIGRDALTHKLVDELGGYEAALKAARTLAKLPDSAPAQRIAPPMSLTERLAMQLQTLSARTAGRWFGGAARNWARGWFTSSSLPVTTQIVPVGEIAKELQGLGSLLQQRGPLAYCFCDVE